MPDEPENFTVLERDEAGRTTYRPETQPEDLIDKHDAVKTIEALRKEIARLARLAELNGLRYIRTAHDLGVVQRRLGRCRKAHREKVKGLAAENAALRARLAEIEEKARAVVQAGNKSHGTETGDFWDAFGDLENYLSDALARAKPAEGEKE